MCAIGETRLNDDTELPFCDSNGNWKMAIDVVTIMRNLHFIAACKIFNDLQLKFQKKHESSENHFVTIGDSPWCDAHGYRIENLLVKNGWTTFNRPVQRMQKNRKMCWFNHLNLPKTLFFSLVSWYWHFDVNHVPNSMVKSSTWNIFFIFFFFFSVKTPHKHQICKTEILFMLS